MRNTSARALAIAGRYEAGATDAGDHFHHVKARRALTTVGSQLKGHRLLLIAFDGLLVNAALLLSLWLRLEGAITPEWLEFYKIAALWLTPFTLVAGCLFGLYNRVWEYARSTAVVAILLAVSSASLLGYLGIWFSRPVLFSRSVLFMAWLLAIALIGGSRFTWRQIRRSSRIKDVCAAGVNGRRRVLIYGAGFSGTAFASQLAVSLDSPYHICGYVDDDPTLNRMIIGEHRVLGSGEDLSHLVDEFDIEEVVLATPSVSGKQLRDMQQRVEEAGAKATILPRPVEQSDAEALSDSVRPLEYRDLLRREMTDVSLALNQDYVGGRTILVTGAGGSIGSDICRQLCRYAPKKLVLLGRGENRIHHVYRELTASFPDVELVPVICNFTNEKHVGDIFAEHRPEVVFHAGAHKHVYLMEDCPAEAVRNNVLGTAAVARQAEKHGVARFVAISTDKAVEPCNVMGATKRLCELLLIGMNRQSDTKFMAVRFGNVIGSSGSVLTIFQNQLAAGRPLTVTHREATRYFMTVEEAAFLVLQAGALGDGGEIFVLDMGEPVCIYDVACELLEMHGRDAAEPGAIEITHLSRGEKVHERLCRHSEELQETSQGGINKAVAYGAAEVPWSPDELIARSRTAADDPVAAEELIREVCQPADRRSAAFAAAGGT